jgi:DNA-binding CsgD family transcriptional regulator/transcriptional regulator with XRE-family HTH domain
MLGGMWCLSLMLRGEFDRGGVFGESGLGIASVRGAASGRAGSEAALAAAGGQRAGQGRREGWRIAGQRFGGELRARREWLQLTQEELAHRAALAVRTIRDLESGRVRRPRAHSVRQIADALLLDEDARMHFVSLARGDAHPARDLALAHGDVDTAVRRLREVVDLAERLAALETLQCAGEALVRVLLSRGEVADAVEVVRRCVAPLMRKDLWLPASRLLPSAVEAWVASGVVAGAQQFLERAELSLRDLDAPLAPAALSYARGVLARSADELVTAADKYDGVPAPYEAGRARERAAGLLFEHGQASAAGIQLKRAAATYERLGATWDYNRAAAAARGHGVKLASRQRGGVRKKYGTELSPRERAVAALAATGRTNKEIAAELFVSTKTVDTHLSAAMRKLGVHSRTAVAHRLSTGR